MSYLKRLTNALRRMLGLDRDPKSHSTGAPSQETSARLQIVRTGNGPAWGSLSGLTAHPTDPVRLFAINDDNSAPIRILEIAVGTDDPEVVRQTAVQAPGFARLDTEGVSARTAGGFWLATEGGKRNHPPNALIEVDGDARMLRALHLPESIGSRMTGKGFEGVAAFEWMGREHVATAFQAPVEGDPDDATRIGIVDVQSGTWRFAYYPLHRIDDDECTGLSDLLHIEGTRFAAIERDGSSKKSAVKWLTVFDLAAVTLAGPDETPALVTKRVVTDLARIFLDAGRKPAKEIEGLARAADGQVYVVTDNDGGGDTFLLRLGASDRLF